MHGRNAFLRWLTSFLLVLAALGAVVVWLVVNVVLGGILPRGAVSDFSAPLLQRVLPIVLVGCAVYLLSSSFYARARQQGEALGWKTHARHAWLLYLLVLGAVYGLVDCFKPRCHPDAWLIYVALGLGGVSGVAADALALRKSQRQRPVAAA